MENIKIFSCSKSADKFTEEICNYLKLDVGKIYSQKFKNDNNFVQILETVRDKDVFLIQTTEPPVNERIMEMLIMVDAIKRATARRITLVLPYYIYSRTDKKDQPRVPVTAKLLAQMIEVAGVNRVLTCDLHNLAIQAYFNNILSQKKSFLNPFLQLFHFFVIELADFFSSTFCISIFFTSCSTSVILTS